MSRTHTHKRDGIEVVDCTCPDWPPPARALGLRWYHHIHRALARLLGGE